MTPYPDLNHLRYQRSKYTTRNPISRRLLAGFHEALCKALAFVHNSGEVQVAVELGCGEGITTWWLRQQLPQAKLIGIDIHLPSLQVARFIVRDTPLIVGDIHRVPLAARSADLVVALEVLEHVPDPNAALQEVERVSRQWCILSVPHEPIWRLLNLARGAYWRDLGNTPGHVNHWSRQHWLKFLSQRLDVVRLFIPLPWLMAVCRTR